MEDGTNFSMPLRQEWYRHLPVKDWAELLEETAPYFADYISHSDDGEYWSNINVLGHLQGIRVPMLHISSWYDIFLEGALNAFQGIRDHSNYPQARRGTTPGHRARGTPLPLRSANQPRHGRHRLRP